jgi:hypothetical protein
VTTPRPPAAIAADAIIADLAARTSGWPIHDERAQADCVATWTTIIAKACADACSQAEPRVRAEERERVARLFDEEAAGFEDRYGRLMRDSAARIRASGDPATLSSAEVPERTAAAERADVVEQIRSLIRVGDAFGNRSAAAAYSSLLTIIERGGHVGAGEGSAGHG